MGNHCTPLISFRIHNVTCFIFIEGPSRSFAWTCNCNGRLNTIIRSWSSCQSSCCLHQRLLEKSSSLTLPPGSSRHCRGYSSTTGSTIPGQRTLDFSSRVVRLVASVLPIGMSVAATPKMHMRVWIATAGGMQCSWNPSQLMASTPTQRQMLA